ncbi:Uu.00g135010.m01.CDS01 [Anthostomella pinea]|uniref:Uu.00g135010.m01.CDS01 n=1 Tax=Anthostomella pinea TaxID=933095 RepID=A0AAI8YIG6_9PEZI|nr:Uu.00g135010.m01.CDS01 [Anthostomella pinea]
MVEALSQALIDEGGTIGFASSFMADVDDTAKTLTCLKLLGRNARPEKMINMFEAEDYFKTYPKERNPSSSANCNALVALLCQNSPQHCLPQITKAVAFLCDTWWSAVSKIQDKWNLSTLYPTLLLVQGFTKLVDLIEKGELSAFSDEVLRSRITICLYQACYRTLLDQSEDDSLNKSVEETAYGTLVLCEARRLDIWRDFDEQLSSAVRRAVVFIQSPEGRRPQCLWIEKVSYTSPFLAEAYRLAALKASTIPPAFHVGSSLRGDTSIIPRLSKLWRGTPLFSKTPEWEIRASMVEGTLFRPIVRERRLSVFTRKGVEEDKYFDVIPLAWPTCSNRTRTFAPPAFLFEGMMAALLNYQVDEFMEAVAGVNYAGRVPELRQLIDHVIDSDPIGDPPNVEEAKRQEVLVPLRKFVTRALKHPAVLSASAWDRKNVTCELRIYFQTHVTQNEDNELLKRHQFSNGVMREHFFRWVRTTSADHTSATYTFNFVSCLLGSWIENGRDCFSSPTEKYYAAAACQHLAAMCRMYNDHGSAVRDRDEGNLNSVDFPEFEAQSGACGGSSNSGDDLAAKKDQLFEIAQYERSCLEEAFRRLEGHSAEASSVEARARKSPQMEIWRLFYNVTDLFGQIYVLRDIGSRLTVGTAG